MVRVALVAVLALAGLATVTSGAIASVAGAPAAPDADPVAAAGAAAGRAQALVPARAARRSLLRIAGVPARWRPARVTRGDYVVRRAGAVVADRRIYGNLLVEAPNVTVRRVEVIGGRIDNNAGPRCHNGLRILRSSVRRPVGRPTSDADFYSIGTGGYTARGVAIRGTAEGFRVGGASAGCGRVRIVNSYARTVAPQRCSDWHGDALQGYDGPALTLRRVSLALVERPGCYGTAPFFYPSGQGNTSVDIRGLRVRGGGYPFRLGTPGQVRGLRIVRGSWGYAPYDVACSRLSAWSARIVGGALRSRPLGCRTEGGR